MIGNSIIVKHLSVLICIDVYVYMCMYACTYVYVSMCRLIFPLSLHTYVHPILFLRSLIKTKYRSPKLHMYVDGRDSKICNQKILFIHHIHI